MFCVSMSRFTWAITSSDFPCLSSATAKQTTQTGLTGL